VNAALSALFPLEVLDSIRHVGSLADDSRARQAGVEDPPGRPDEGPTSLILSVAWLLADEEQIGACGTFTEHRLRRSCPEVAAAALACRAPQTRQRGAGRHERFCPRRSVAASGC
jgi:hypothetical protein